MASELEKVANDLMAALDSKDLDRIVESIGEDAQGVDEISRRWLRGEGELDSYMRQMLGAVSGLSEANCRTLRSAFGATSAS